MAESTVTENAVKHTPGPWRLGGVNQNVVYGTEPEYRPSLVVAHCNHTGEVPPEVDQANARLIAAAPELLEACRLFTAAAHEARDEFNNRGLACPASIAFAAEQARHAIAKAEGR